ncbi:MAG: MFS transporter [Cyclobacteriaceae bacterium]|nr:MFS transporter [Cyclobacteriaceae bacterium]
MQRKYVVLILLSVLSVITFLDRNAISLAGQRITEELQLTDGQFGWILSAFTIAYGVFEIPTGLMGDRFGAKRILIRVVLWWSFFTIITGFAGGFASLFIIRFMFGAGEAGAYPNTAIAIRGWFPAVERARAQALIWMSSRIGGAIAPFLVIPLQMHYGWRVSFYVLGAVGVVWVLIWTIMYRDAEENHEPVTKSEDGVSWKVWLSNGNFWLLMMMYFCYAGGVFFFISWLPRYLQNGRGITEDQLAYSASLPFFLAAIGCLAGGSISDLLVKKIGMNWGRRLVPLIGLILSGSSMLMVAMITDNSVAIIFLALGLAFMDVTAPVSWAVATSMGGKNSGAITGAMNTAGLLAGTLISVGVGYVVTSFHSYTIPVVVIGALLIFGGFLWLFIDADRKL